MALARQPELNLALAKASTPTQRLVVALDFDGTLVDLPVDWVRVRAELDDLYVRWGISSSVRSLFPRLDFVLAQLAATRDRQAFHVSRRKAFDVLDCAESVAAASATPVPGAIAFTRWLANSGIRWGVATNNAEAPVVAVLARLGFERPPIVIGRIEAHRFKPAPDCLAALADFYGSPPDGLVMVGDSDNDVAAAGAFGARSIYLKRPGHRGLLYTRPWRTARSFTEVARLMTLATTRESE